MKKQQIKRSAIYLCQALLAVSIISLASCKKPPVDDGGETGPVHVDNDNAQGEIVVSEDYTPIDWNKTENHVAEADTASGRFVLNLGKDEVKSISKGDILTLDVDSAIYLRKVTSVTKSDGSVEVQTRQAYPDEIFAGSTFQFCIGTPPDSILDDDLDLLDAETRAEICSGPKPLTIYPSEVRYKDENGNWVRQPVSGTRLDEGWQEWTHNLKKELSTDLGGGMKCGIDFNLDIGIKYAASLTGDLLEVTPEDFEGDEEAAKKALERSKAKWKPTFYLDPSIKGSADVYMKVEKEIEKLSKEKVVGEKVVKAFLFFVGPVPVELEIVAGLQFKNTFQIAGVLNANTSLELGLDHPIVAGMYKSSTHGWKATPFKKGNLKLTMNYPAVTISGEISDEFVLGPYLALHIYHLGGPRLNLDPSFTISASVGAGATFGSKDIVGETDWAGPNLTLGWDASLKYQTKWSVGVGASEVLGGGSFQSKPKEISAAKTLLTAPNDIVCLNPEEAKVGECCAMKFKVRSWLSYLIGSTTFGSHVPVPVQFRSTEALVLEDMYPDKYKEIQESLEDEKEAWCYKWTDFGTGEITIYWTPRNEESVLTACYFDSKGGVGGECTVKPSTAPGNVKAVDLGTSVLWANMNVGASEEWDVGDYVGWGATKKQTKQWENPDWGDYVNDPYLGLDWYGGLYRDRGIQKGRYDYATLKWGGEWRMPLKAHWDELINKCDWEFDEDRKAYKVSGNGNYIWLPAAGWECGTKGFGGVGTELNYWSASLNEDSPYQFSYTPDGVYGTYTCYPTAWYLYAKPIINTSGGSLTTNATQRCYRQSVRAIAPKTE